MFPLPLSACLLDLLWLPFGHHYLALALLSHPLPLLSTHPTAVILNTPYLLLTPKSLFSSTDCSWKQHIPTACWTFESEYSTGISHITCTKFELPFSPKNFNPFILQNFRGTMIYQSSKPKYVSHLRIFPSQSITKMVWFYPISPSVPPLSITTSWFQIHLWL